MTIHEITKVDPKAVKFTMTDLPVLEAGREDRPLARTGMFTARGKVYAEGGENATHAHPNEDHLFLVLAGQATFHIGREGEDVVVAERYDGVLVPRGSFYRFVSSGDENLVMFRVGHDESEDRERTDPHGDPLPGYDSRNNHMKAVSIPGKFFGM